MLKVNIIISLKIKMLFSDAFSFFLSLLWRPQSCRELKLQNSLDRGYINYIGLVPPLFKITLSASYNFKKFHLHICTLGSSDFPRSLCFIWFWFSLEILRLVYKKVFLKILIGFYLIWAFNFQKNSTVP